MTFESLPNELLCELFEYFDATDLFRAFHGLNVRFNKLLLTQREYHLNFQHTAPEEFDVISQKYLPSIVDRLISIEIHDATETPQFSMFFFQHIFQRQHIFVQLKSLTICSINDHSLLITIIKKCTILNSLTHLNIIGQQCSNISNLVYEYIWNIPSLTHCNLCAIRGLRANQMHTLDVSNSIKNLTIAECDLHKFFQILQSTPNLQRLEVVNLEVGQFTIGAPSTFLLTSLRIFFRGKDSYLIYIFQNLPQLRCLTIENSNISWDGYDWERVINEHLPKLKILRFKMERSILLQYKSVDFLLESFQTPFWLIDHQWYVGCYWDPKNIHRVGIIYTLPYAFNSLDINNDWHFKTTAVEDIHKLLCCRRVQDVTYSGENCLEHQVPFYCPNIHKLYIDLPYEFKSFSWFSSLITLKSLYISIRPGFDYDRLQLILNELPYLYSLNLDLQGVLCQRLFQLTSSSIRRLDLSLLSYSPCFTLENCNSLILSSLGRRCEVLSIQVDSLYSILRLIQDLPKLRALRYQWTSSIQSYRAWNTELVNLLEKHLPSVCSVDECTRDLSQVDIWINRQLKYFIRSSTNYNNSFYSFLI